jgi:RNA polymerase sigma-70 factor (ECF subfamily)
MFNLLMDDLSDRLQFESAYARLAPLARRIANSVLRDPAAAEDVVQDVFLGLWRNPRSFDPGRGTLSTYVAMLAQSRSLDRRRSLGAQASAFQRLADEARAVSGKPSDDLVDVAHARERRGRLLAAVGELPAEQRDAILLAFGQGLTAREIAFRGRLPLGTAKSRIRLGLAKAREQLGEAA